MNHPYHIIIIFEKKLDNYNYEKEDENDTWEEIREKIRLGMIYYLN